MPSISIVLGDHPHAKPLKSLDAIAGVSLSYPEIRPVHDAFDDMIRLQRYDVCELAIGAFLQAHEEGQPLLLLPVVLAGRFHYASIYTSDLGRLTEPKRLRGHRVGVRAYSQTTGLWVRQILAEEYGVGWSDVTWVTTEGSHSGSYVDPPNVVRTDRPLIEELRTGGIAAAILGPSSEPMLAPLFEDPVRRARDWYARHQTVPINHMVAVTRDVAEKHPGVVGEIYCSLVQGIDRARSGGVLNDPSGLPTGVRYGRDNIRSALRLAAESAFDQHMISRKVEDIDALFAL